MVNFPEQERRGRIGSCIVCASCGKFRSNFWLVMAASPESADEIQ